MQIPPPDDPNDPGATRRLTSADWRTIPPEGGLPASMGRSQPPAPLYPNPYTHLPERVDEVDLNATRVSPVAVQSYNGRGGKQAGGNSQTWGCFLRGLVVALFLGAALAIVVAIAGVMAYSSIASTLPSVDDLRARAAQFETTRILDRNGNQLYQILDPNKGRRNYVPLAEIDPDLVAATIATEDKEFYNHPGFDLFAIARALWQNLAGGEIQSGASTITQQLARALLFSPEEQVEQSYNRKIREVILAAEITRQYSKDEILELYLNEIYYGNLCYGIEAAAETYFNTTADNLTLGQATFLAGLPQSPGIYDIHTMREATLTRHRDVLVLIYTLSQETNCIRVSNSDVPVCVGVQEALTAQQEIENFTFPQPNITVRYPHWVQYVREQLEAKFDAQTIYRSGFTVYTSIDPALQDAAQQIVAAQVAALVNNNASNGALVAIRPQTGEILAMVGSADFYNDAIDGQVNMATSPTRQPGSSIKPITYLAAFEKGWNPATLIWDVPSYFPPSGDPNDPREPYAPVNYDGRFHGPVSARAALANSYNIPAVKTLQYVGIYDNPATPQRDGMIGMAERLGITSLTRNDYGLALTLGGGEVSLIEMTGAFATLANQGMRMPPVAILKITNFEGDVIFEYQPPAGEQVVRPEHVYLVTSILADNEARAPMFGRNSMLSLPFPVAAKTGTTNDFRDNWTMGYTPDLAVGVWVGNADYTPMINSTGLSGAAPIWSQFLQTVIPTLTNNNPGYFVRPPGILDRVICVYSGAEPSKLCPQQASEIFFVDQPPPPPSEDLWKSAILDTWTGLLASESCKDYVDERLVMNVTDEHARRWLRKDPIGQNWAEQMGFERPIYFVPERKCDGNSPRPVLEIRGIADGEKITADEVELRLVAYASAGFENWVLEWGQGADPDQWEAIVGSEQAIRQPETFTWEVGKLDNGRITLRLYLTNKDGGYAEKRITFRLDYTPPTEIPTETPTLTATPPPSQTPEPPTEVPTDLPPMPSETPTETPTEAPLEPSPTP